MTGWQSAENNPRLQALGVRGSLGWRGQVDFGRVSEAGASR